MTPRVIFLLYMSKYDITLCMDEHVILQTGPQAFAPSLSVA
jgi:hypothetical protein